MFRTILLLSPIYITLFWSIALSGNRKKSSSPHKLLSKFMLFPSICFMSMFFYYEPFPEIYPYFDCIFQFAATLIFPLYYIYFRLLTIDEKFTLKLHAQYLAIPVVLATMYCIAAFLTPWTEYKRWLFNENFNSDTLNIQFLDIMREIIRILFVVQLVFAVIGNQFLIHKYGVKAEQFYSDMEEKNYKNAKIMNYCIIIVIVVAVITFVLEYGFKLPHDTLLYIIFGISSIILYLIGYIGIKQESINPTFDFVSKEIVTQQLEVIPVDSRKKILRKMLIQFEEEKIYLNSQLNIMDIVQAVGTNRTYISSIINQQYNQNFCSFVNSYRIEELEKVLVENPEYTNEILADCCGFGSLNSMKRAVYAKTGLSLPVWKKQIIISNNIKL